MKLIDFVLRKFFKAASENPMIYVEALFPMRSHTRKSAAIEPEVDKQTGLSDDDEDRPVSRKQERVVILTNVWQPIDPEFPDGAQRTRTSKKRPRPRRRRSDGEPSEPTTRQEQAQAYLSAKFIEDSDEGVSETQTPTSYLTLRRRRLPAGLLQEGGGPACPS